MRTGEVFALTWNDIDLEKRVIKISKTVYSKLKDDKVCDTLYKVLYNYKQKQNILRKQHGKNYKRYYLEEIKNKYGKIVEYQIIETSKKKNNVEMVFTRKDGTYTGTDIIKYPFKIIHKELKIENCRFYDLRGSYATKSLRNGAEIKDVAEILGHSNIETTENYYVSSTKESRKEASIILENKTQSDIINKIINFEKIL